MFRDWASRYLYTAAQSLTVVEHWLGPDAVSSQASGSGVSWLKSLYRTQSWLYTLSKVMVSSVGLTTFVLLTSVFGNPVKAPQSEEPTPCSMFRKNATFCAVTGCPFDHM